MTSSPLCICNYLVSQQRRHLGGLGGRCPPRKKKKRKKEEKREKREKKRKKRKIKKGTMNDVKLRHTKCCFFQFFKSGGIKKLKKFLPPKKKYLVSQSQAKNPKTLEPASSDS